MGDSGREVVSRPRARKVCITVVDVVHKNTVDRTKDTVSRMARELQFRPVSDQVNDAISHFAIFVPGPLALEVENRRVKPHRSFEVAAFDDRNNLHGNSAGRQGNRIIGRSPSDRTDPGLGTSRLSCFPQVKWSLIDPQFPGPNDILARKHEMKYLNREVLEGLSAEKFKKAQPYPFAHIDYTLTAEGYEALRTSLPAVETFDRHEGMKRGHGQMPHNRFMLHYKAGLELPKRGRSSLASCAVTTTSSSCAACWGIGPTFPLSRGTTLGAVAQFLPIATRRASGPRTSSTSTMPTIGARRGAARR